MTSYVFGRKELMFIPGVGAVEWPPFIAQRYKGNALVVSAAIAINGTLHINDRDYTSGDGVRVFSLPSRPDPGPLQPNVAGWIPEERERLVFGTWKDGDDG